MNNLQQIDWSRLPQPEDDGGARHLTGPIHGQRFGNPPGTAANIQNLRRPCRASCCLRIVRRSMRQGAEGRVGGSPVRNQSSARGHSASRKRSWKKAKWPISACPMAAGAKRR